MWNTMSRHLSPLLALLLAGLLATGCARQVGPDRGPAAYYQTAHPAHDTSGPLERVLEAVRRIEVTSLYETYHFAEDEAPTTREALDEDVLSRAAEVVSTERTRSATAVVVSRSGRDILMLTARHAVHFPDTVVQYFDRGRPTEPIEPQSRRIRSISILRQRSNWVMGLPSMDPFDVMRIPVPHDMGSVVVYPHLEIEVQEARALLEDAITLDDFVEQSANLAGFIGACFRDDRGMIGRSLEDLIVEPQRSHLIPGFAEVQQAALDAGALGTSISGAGPAIFALHDFDTDPGAICKAMIEAFEAEDVESTGLVSPLNGVGAHIVERGESVDD